MTDRWAARPEPGPDQAQLCWHVLMGAQPQIRAVAAVARRRLESFPGLHVTPESYLHLRVLPVGLAGDLAPSSVDAMVGLVRRELQRMPPVTVCFGRVLYHPETVSLGMQPGDALDSMSAVIRAATDSALGRPGEAAGQPWVPHVTIAYSARDQPAAPIIAALGRELPECEITIDRVTLVAQHGPEREWRWQPLASASLG
jgi:2'-5' RNA ligase